MCDKRSRPRDCNKRRWLRANAAGERHAAQNIVRPARPVMVFAAQLSAAQIQRAPRRHSYEIPGDRRAADRAFAQNEVQRAGVAAARAWRERPSPGGELRVREPRLACAGQYVRDAVVQDVVGRVSACCRFDCLSQRLARIAALRDRYGRKTVVRRREVQGLTCVCREKGIPERQIVDSHASVGQMHSFAQADLEVAVRSGDASSRVHPDYLRHSELLSSSFIGGCVFSCSCSSIRIVLQHPRAVTW